MQYDLFCNEAEYLAAINKTQRYVSFLQEQLENYRCTVKTLAIVSEKVAPSLCSLNENADAYAESLEALAGSLIGSMNKQITDLERIDNFRYPDASMSDVITMLAAFL